VKTHFTYAYDAGAESKSSSRGNTAVNGPSTGLKINQCHQLPQHLSGISQSVLLLFLHSDQSMQNCVHGPLSLKTRSESGSRQKKMLFARRCSVQVLHRPFLDDVGLSCMQQSSVIRLHQDERATDQADMLLLVTD